jgi:hypothetical protein
MLLLIKSFEVMLGVSRHGAKLFRGLSSKGGAFSCAAQYCLPVNFRCLGTPQEPSRLKVMRLSQGGVMICTV